MPRSPEMLPVRNQDSSHEKSDKKIWGNEKRNGLMRAGMVAAALHAPLLPVLGEKLLPDVQAIDHQKEFEKRWKTPNVVLRPQSDEKRAEVEALRMARIKRSNPDAVRSFQQQAAERLEHGEHVTYRELYFQQERLNGVEPEKVAQAEQLANERIAYYSSQMEHGLDDSLIRRISREMHDQTEYDWGQGSVTGFFVDHKRNCVSYTRAEHIVFEGVISQLSQSVRERYMLGERKESQHQFATLKLSSGEEGALERLHLLQPPFLIEQSGEPPAGVADISEKLLKEALTGKQIVIKAAKPNKGESQVDSGPRIDFATNQPVDDGIVVDGPLRDADANRREARRERLLPMTIQEYDQKYGEMELEIVEDVDSPTIEEVESRVNPPEMVRELKVQAADFFNPSVKTVATIGDSMYSLAEVHFGKISRWSRESIDAAIQLQTTKLSFELDEQGKLPTNFIELLQQRVARLSERKSVQLPWEILELRSGGSTRIDTGQLEAVLKVFHKERVKKDNISEFKSLQLSENLLASPEVVQVLSKNVPDAIYVSHSHVNSPQASSDILRSLKEVMRTPIYVQFQNWDSTSEGLEIGLNRRTLEVLDDADLVYPDIFSYRYLQLKDLSNWLKEKKTYKAKLVDTFLSYLLKYGTPTDGGMWGSQFIPDQTDYQWVTSMPISALQTKSPEEWLQERQRVIRARNMKQIQGEIT